MTNQRVLSVRSSSHWPLCTGSDHPQANQFTLGLRSSSYWSLCNESNHHQTNQCIQSPRSFSLNFVCLVRSSSETVRGENVDSAEGVALYIDAYFQQWWWWIWCTCWDFTFVNFMLYTVWSYLSLSHVLCGDQWTPWNYPPWLLELAWNMKKIIPLSLSHSLSEPTVPVVLLLPLVNIIPCLIHMSAPYTVLVKPCSI